MRWVELSMASGGDEVPLAFAVAVYSVGVMLALLGAVSLTYLVRHRVERAEKAIQHLHNHEYLRQIQAPAAAVVLAAVSGYGVNIVTQDQGLLGYVGFLLAMPIPLAMVVWSGVRTVRQNEFEQRWPPESLPGGDRVKIRFTLRRVLDEGADLATADLTRVSAVLELLLDKALPALRALGDRSLRRWISEHRRLGIGLAVWAVATVGCAAWAVMVQMPASPWRASVFVLGFAAVVALTVLGTVYVVHRHDRYRFGALADEIADTAGALRRRITEHRLGLAARPRIG